MSIFTAYEGRATVERFSESLEVRMGRAEVWLSPWAVNTLREYFRQERNEAGAAPQKDARPELPREYPDNQGLTL